MALGLVNLEFLNHNAQRRYPFADDADLTDTTGTFTLPNSFIVELDLPIHAGLDVSASSFFLYSIGVFSGGYGVVIGYQPASGDPISVASAFIPRQDFTRNKTFVLGGLGDFADTIGKIVIGRFDDIDNQAPGYWLFTLETARLDPDAVRPIIRGVSSITCVNGDQRSAALYGDIELVAGSNMRIDTIVQAGQNPIIRFNAINGAGTIDPCVCTGDAAVTDPITSINGVGPTPAGEFNIVGSACVQITPITNGIKIEDTCSAPCCGCAELERITQDLTRLMTQGLAVEKFIDKLGAAVDTMSLVVLGSRISDNGCVTCG